MKNENRTHCVLLGLLCLMPALFFWALKSLPIEYEESAVLLYSAEQPTLNSSLPVYLSSGGSYPGLGGFSARRR